MYRFPTQLPIDPNQQAWGRSLQRCEFWLGTNWKPRREVNMNGENGLERDLRSYAPTKKKGLDEHST